MNLIRVYFTLANIDTDTISSIGNLSCPPGTTALTLTAINPLFWIEENTNGESKLCTVKTDQGPLGATFAAAEIPYSAPALNFEVVEFFGGHPVHRPGY